ncbi:hypothetical protein RFI_06124 [Reticulomyxa filosa]|uniref:Uncharacterized protein n=1 Tax=Reticulomyxa filosa TaxID=46433 RepID=X6NXG2_RETFI|nr:hypothetical protein RFI_06124 [Reticulomyxa filosa]|eukprot:ETO30995.1 hypothetical protein RFI_06124 [Reticulomyxa filosa]
MTKLFFVFIYLIIFPCNFSKKKTLTTITYKQTIVLNKAFLSEIQKKQEYFGSRIFYLRIEVKKKMAATWIAWIVFAIALLILIGLIWGFLSYFKSKSVPNESWKLTLFICSTALLFAFLSLLVIPVDVYFASSTSEYDSSSNRNKMQWVYYGFDIVLMCFVFTVMPFAYFMFEEGQEDDLGSPGRRKGGGSTFAQRACNALKYTFGFTIVFVVLIVIGAFINFNNANSDSNDENSQWRSTVTNSFKSHSSRIVPFCLAILMTVGLFFSMIYTSWGLAYIPISIMRTMAVTYNSSNQKASHKKGGSAAETDLKNVNRDIEFLDSKYYGREDSWSKPDQEKKQKLLRDKRQLERRAKVRSYGDRGGRGGGGAAAARNAGDQDSGENVCCALLWNASAPVRYVVGLGLLAWGGLVIACMMMHLLDEALNSDCGYSCGFQLKTYNWSIPIETLLSQAAKVFPLDYILFALIVVWLFVATIAGVVALDVRVLCFKLFRFRPHGTLQNALIMGVGFIIVIAASFTYLMMTLAPHYTSYGSSDQDCNVDTCRATAVYYILSGIQIGMPIFGLIYFIFSWVFIAVFFLSVIWNLCKGSIKKEWSIVDDGLEDEFRD